MRKTILYVILVTFAINSYGQQKTTKKQLFLRIFDGKGKKIHKGFLEQTTDSSLFIIQQNKSVEVLSSGVSSIKLRRSFGHTILLTSLIGGATVAILGAVSALKQDDQQISFYTFNYSAGEGALAGFILGGGAGVGLGSIIAGTKSKPVFKVNQNTDNWIKVRALLDAYLTTK